MYTDGEGWSRNSHGERRNPRWGSGFFHSRKSGFPAYTDPRLAALIDPAFSYFPNHVEWYNPYTAYGKVYPTSIDIETPHLWEAETENELHIDSLGIRVYARELRTVRETPHPNIPVIHHVKFAIRCVMEVNTDNDWQAWARAWLSDDYTTSQNLKYQISSGGAFQQPEAKSVIEAAGWYYDIFQERKTQALGNDIYQLLRLSFAERSSAKAVVQAAESAKYLGKKIDFIGIASKLDS